MKRKHHMWVAIDAHGCLAWSLPPELRSMVYDNVFDSPPHTHRTPKPSRILSQPPSLMFAASSALRSLRGTQPEFPRALCFLEAHRVRIHLHCLTGDGPFAPLADRPIRLSKEGCEESAVWCEKRTAECSQRRRAQVNKTWK